MSGIDPQVLKFFKTLSKNNNRDWFEAHKPEFKALEADPRNANKKPCPRPK